MCSKCRPYKNPSPSCVLPPPSSGSISGTAPTTFSGIKRRDQYSRCARTLVITSQELTAKKGALGLEDTLVLVHHFIHSLVLMYKFLIYFKNLFIKPVEFDFSTSEFYKRYQGQCSSFTAIKADSISHGQIALTPKVIVSLTQSQQLFLSFLFFLL